jgi:hypothetical protein
MTSGHPYNCGCSACQQPIIEITETTYPGIISVAYEGTQGTQGVPGIISVASEGPQGAKGVQGTQGVQGYQGSGLYTYSELPPINPSIGDRWVCTLNGYEYTYLQDLNSSQWVDTRTSGFLGPQGIQGTQGLQGYTGAQGTTSGITYKALYPNSNTATGSLGEICIDGTAGDLYICTGTNTWQKIALNSDNFTNTGGFN